MTDQVFLNWSVHFNCKYEGIYKMKQVLSKNMILKKAGIGAVITFLLVLLDQITKRLAVSKLMGQKPFVIIDGVFELNYLENRGAAFGMFQGAKIYFIIFTIIALFAIGFVYLVKLPATKRFLPFNIVAVLFLAGAIGNFIDRICYSYVIDFFYFKLIDFPIFNVADIYVTVATFLMVILILFYYKDDDYELIFPSKQKGS